jgi:signal transduction histidine kinase/DNA-binding response OmpR family regulator
MGVVMQQLSYSIEGESETAVLARCKDWCATPLGPVEQWPQSLRTSLSICLACRFPIFVIWGPEMVVFYNDAFIPVLGNQHPAAMGGRACEVWADVWPVVGPMLQSVLATGQAVKADDLPLLMKRNGYDEETYFSFSYSPIADETCGVGGIFTPVFESTEKVIGHRRIELLRMLGSRPRADTLAGACDTLAAALAGACADLPFGMIYTIDAASGGARLAASFGLDEFPDAAPRDIAAGDEQQLWQVVPAARAREPRLVEDLHRAGLALPGGAWGAPVTQALAIPIATPGQDGVVAVLVAAVSPHRALDGNYRSFYKLLADQVQGTLGAALSYEAERKRAAALAEIDRAKTTFFSNISHEFRTPLTLMLGPIEQMLDGEQLPDATRQHLVLVHRNGVRLLKLVNALLDFSRIEAGRMVASFEPLDLSAFTADLAGVFRSAIERAGMRLVVDCPPLDTPVHADRGMWEKIVLNLLSNAFKFTFEGTIAVRLCVQDGRAVLSVSDTGVGIDALDLPRLFERFHRIEGARSRSHEGSGIGLALVRDLVELHGGATSIDSSLDVGTTVTVALPLGSAHLPPEQVTQQMTEGRSSQALAYMAEAELWLGAVKAEATPLPHEERSTVFVVDDNADMREYVAGLLTPLHAVRTFADGLQALEAARFAKPALIVSDVMMPVMGGYELLAALRADRALAAIPLLLLSARAGEEARISAARAGTDDYLEKPFSSRELLAKVDALLLRSRIREIESIESARMEAVFRHAPAAIALLHGPEHVFELANPLYLELVGNRDLLHKPIRQALPELAGSGVYELLDEVYRTGKPHEGHALRADVMRADLKRADLMSDQPPALHECYFDFVYQPMPDASGAVEGVAVVVFDVTETVQAKRSAEQASRAKDEFIAILGHELRNPLAPIVTALEVMKLRGIHAVQKEHGIIERQALHLVGLVNDLLDVARVSRGKVELRRELAEAASIVACAVETASPLLEERRHRLLMDVPKQGLALDVDRQRVSQVLANLLTNAAKYSDNGSEIVVCAWRDGRDVVFEVRDSGRGIAGDMLPHIFDMFYQDPQSLSRSRGGLGLGLTIVRSLVELHGGSVAAASAGAGLGSTFTVRLPAADPRQDGARCDAGAGAAQAADEGALASILVVDDNVDAAETLRELLQMLGYAVEIAFDGPSALRKLQARWPDVAVLDIGLPGMDGYELAARIRQARKPIQLVALSGYGQESDTRRALAAGFDRHLTKPVSFDELQASVGELVARADAGSKGGAAR